MDLIGVGQQDVNQQGNECGSRHGIWTQNPKKLKQWCFAVGNAGYKAMRT
jgi:hypothetical protein